MPQPQGLKNKNVFFFSDLKAKKSKFKVSCVFPGSTFMFIGNALEIYAHVLEGPNAPPQSLI